MVMVEGGGRWSWPDMIVGVGRRWPLKLVRSDGWRW